jgi:hypothetical protein
MASFTCPPGSICPPSAGEPIGANKTKIFYSTATTVTQGSDGKVNGAERVLYIDKNGSYQPAAISKDGGKTYNFSDPKYPLMDGVAGADLQKDLNNPASGIHKNVDAGIAKHLPKAGIPPTQQQSVVASTANQATNPGAGAPIDGAAISKAVGVKEGTRNKFPGAAGEKPLVYPITLRDDFQDVIKFSMIQYRPKTFSQTTLGFGERKTAGTTDIIGTVILPIPNGISDANAVTWGGADMNAAQAAGVRVATAGMTGGGAAAAGEIEGLIKTAAGATAELQAAAVGAFAEAATGVQGILARTAGIIINPNLELLFSAPTLRPFNFTFKLASRSETESKTIRSIIRFFKQGMSPIRTQSQLFLKAPHTFQIQYLHKNEEHKFLNKFKECALQSFSVSYTPEGQYATFNDGAMVSYQITMQFQELEPIFNDDYTNDGTNPSPDIGY